MRSLPVLDRPPGVAARRQRLPAWLKRPLPAGNENFFTEGLLRELGLETVTDTAVQVRTPHLLGNAASNDRVLDSPPEVYNHNMETVPRLYAKVRGRAHYQRSLDLLARVKSQAAEIITKSGLMLGLGETIDE